MAEADPPKSTEVARGATDLDAAPDASPVGAEALPIVARLAIEIRSDGTRTIARGAMHDLASGEQVAIEVGGGSPLQLARQLTTQVTGIVASVVARALGKSLPGRLLRRRLMSRP